MKTFAWFQPSQGAPWGIGLLIFLCTLSTGSCQPQVPGESWRYALLEDSYFVDDCPICGRPTIQEPMRGTFDLVLLEGSDKGWRFGISNVLFRASLLQDRTITGGGMLEIVQTGDIPEQTMTLDLRINDVPKVFTNDIRILTRRLPMTQTHLFQVEFNWFQYFSINVAAAPLRDIWFITQGGFFSTNLNSIIESGDLLSQKGNVLRTRQAITHAFGFDTEPGALGGATVGPGSEVLFTLNGDFYSQTNGTTYKRGDILSERGTRLIGADALTANFEPSPPDQVLGTDALQIAPHAGDILFSVETDFISQRIGEISSGDVLSYNPDGGGTNRLLRTSQQLVALLEPLDVTVNPGLDALYLWPGGEIWFSTERGFDSRKYGPITSGDLLSDHGYIVSRNSDLMSAFAPSTGTTNVGLKGIHLVSDAVVENTQPFIITITNGTAGLELEWIGAGRAFQVESASTPTGPYTPVSPILPATNLLLPITTLGDQGYFRIRSW